MRFAWDEFSKYGAPIERTSLHPYPSLPNMDERTRALMEEHVRRGIPIARLKKDRERTNYYMSPGELMGYRYEFGQLMIGKLGQTFLGYADDRPMMLIAGTRAGKTSTILEPNFYLYSGSMLVLDPKGELAQTASLRRLMGHVTHVLDPFGVHDGPSASFNPLAELDPQSPRIVGDVMAVAHALVPDVEGGGNAKHFNDSARTLLAGLIFITLTRPKRDRHLITVRELLCLTYGPLVTEGQRAAAAMMASASKHDKKRHFDMQAVLMGALLDNMKNLDAPFGRAAAGMSGRLGQTPPTERGSIFSTAAVHTDFLDSILLQRTLRHSDFKLADLRGDRPTSIYLCLPVGQMESHSRWLRVVVQLACTVLESLGTYPRDRLPVLFVLEEFATLNMPFMERASSYFPGFGIRPLFVVQDITQLKKTYPQSWESFLGNSGLVQVFANGDGQTLNYVAQRLGKLITPWEFEQGFAREHESQLLMIKGRPPAVASRLSHEDVARIRARFANGLHL
ncbi:type IV secretory system conjugative DNA transfer family protein [Bradyrhizobium iriomotense]|uniref:Type IV secretory system conjugative DNA transfer family protein n=1 Tax=Bradyrhizobium iriomotense TaxID=441950 RepID=A0ABQ6AWF3_9BRAD|nr:type IV secretory system conjugative DNA transfer family protein [Bradyrhizobium iriomotense]GLR86532.1 hypothetical protein GCM10007857_32430 [Bradyrhizobium iriomotense]